MWINPVDKMPQIPVDWANHIAQGGLYTIAMIVAELAVAHLTGYELTPFDATLYASYAMTAASVAKKLVDYIKEFETVRMCVGKSIVTVLWPWSLVAAQWLARGH